MLKKSRKFMSKLQHKYCCDSHNIRSLPQRLLRFTLILVAMPLIKKARQCSQQVDECAFCLKNVVFFVNSQAPTGKAVAQSHCQRKRVAWQPPTLLGSQLANKKPRHQLARTGRRLNTNTLPQVSACATRCSAPAHSQRREQRRLGNSHALPARPAAPHGPCFRSPSAARAAQADPRSVPEPPPPGNVDAAPHDASTGSVQ